MGALATLVEPVLVACAVALGGVLVSGVITPRGSALPFERVAEASGDVTSLGDYTVLSSGSSGEDILTVVDNQTERLMVYRLNNRRTIDYLQSLSLQRVFIEARATYRQP